MRQITLDLVNAMELSIALGEYLGYVELHKPAFQNRQINPDRLHELVMNLDKSITTEMRRNGK